LLDAEKASHLECQNQLQVTKEQLAQVKEEVCVITGYVTRDLHGLDKNLFINFTLIEHILILAG